MRDEAHLTLETMRLPNGLYVASLSEDYKYVWIRDTCYAAMAYLDTDDGRYEQTYHALLDILHRYRWKLEYHAIRRPSAVYEYIHPRYSAEDCSELHAPWGNAQNDAVGLLLYGIGAGLQQGKGMLRDRRDREIVQLLVRYLANLRFWEDADNGMWEEARELHASSVAACVAGVMAVAPYVHVDWEDVAKGMASLYRLLPNESAAKTVDLAQLSIIYPYQLLPAGFARFVLCRVEQALVRERGVIRYPGDHYYREGGREAQWTFGFPWLGLCYVSLGEFDAAMKYLRRTEQVMTSAGVLPELYLAESGHANGNTPLAWSVSMYMQLRDRLFPLRS